MTQKNTLLIVVAIGAAFVLSRSANAMPRQNVPGATPVMGGYLQSPAYAGQYGQPYSPAVWQQQRAAADQGYGALGSALGNVFNKIIGNTPSEPVASSNPYSFSNSGADNSAWMNDGNPVGTAPDLGQYVPGSQAGMNNFYG